MNLLLDTHALLWWWTDDAQLPASARQLIQRGKTVCVSAASMWELATKLRLGKLAEAEAAVAQFDALVQADGFVHLPMHWRHAQRAGGMDHAHKDPFDRMLAAQAHCEGLHVLTRDPMLAALGAKVVW